MPFYGDKASNLLSSRLKTLFHRFSPAAKPIVLFQTRKIPVSSPKDRLPVPLACPIVYSFLCSCGAAYIGRTARSLKTRSREHIPKWLLEGRSGRCNSAVTAHLQQCDFDPETIRDKFSIVCRCRHERIMRITEALFIQRDRPMLCRQKDHVINLRLPW